MDTGYHSGTSLPPHKIPGHVSNVPAGFGACSRSPRGDRHNDGERGSGNSFRPRLWFLEPPVFGRESLGRLATRNGPLAPERVSSSNTVQDGNTKLSSAGGQKERLPRLYRPQGRLLPDSDSPLLQEAPPFRLERYGLPVQSPMFRAVNRPARVFAAVSSWAHSRGVRLLRYLDDWLILSSSETKTRHHVDQLLTLCRSLGIVIKTEKSDLSPSRSVEYLGMVIDTVSA